MTSDRFARDLAARFGFEVIADDVNPGETGAIEMATAFFRDRGALHTLVIPADIPLIEVSELVENCGVRASVRCGAGAGCGWSRDERGSASAR